MKPACSDKLDLSGHCVPPCYASNQVFFRAHGGSILVLARQSVYSVARHISCIQGRCQQRSQLVSRCQPLGQPQRSLLLKDPGPFSMTRLKGEESILISTFERNQTACSGVASASRTSGCYC